MKKIFLKFCILVVLFSCSQTPSNGRRVEVEAFVNETEKIKVLTTTEMIGNLA